MEVSHLIPIIAVNLVLVEVGRLILAVPLGSVPVIPINLVLMKVGHPIPVIPLYQSR